MLFGSIHCKWQYIFRFSRPWGQRKVTDHTGRHSVQNIILHGQWLATIRVMEVYLAVLEEYKESFPKILKSRGGNSNFRDKTISNLIEKYLWNEQQGLHPLTELGSRKHYDQLVKKQRDDAKRVVEIVQLLLQAEDTLKELFPTSNAISAVSEVVAKHPEFGFGDSPPNFAKLLGRHETNGDLPLAAAKTELSGGHCRYRRRRFL